jgi:hypothetical protein
MKSKPEEELTITDHTIAAGAYDPAANPPANDSEVVQFEPEDVPPQQVAVTPAALSPEMAQLAQILQQNMLTAVAEMKKPSPEEQAKIDDERSRRAQLAMSIALQTKQSLATKKARQAACRHALHNGKTSFRGQVNSDGCYRPYCAGCDYVSPPIRGDQFRINNQPLDLYKLDADKLTIPILEAMAAASLPPLPVSPLPVGAEVDLTAL